MKEEVRHFHLLWRLTLTGWDVRAVLTEKPAERPDPLPDNVVYWMGFSCKVISDIAQFTPEEELWGQPYDFVIAPGKSEGYAKLPCVLDRQFESVDG